MVAASYGPGSASEQQEYRRRVLSKQPAIGQDECRNDLLRSVGRSAGNPASQASKRRTGSGASQLTRDRLRDALSLAVPYVLQYS